MDRDTAVEGVVRALRRVNFQGSIFGQTIAVRLGLSESDIDALEWLLDTGAATAGRLSEVMGLTSGAVTRVIDRLEQAGYVRRTTDPSDRRRVIVEVVPERVGTIESVLDSLERAAASEVDRYTPEQLAVINDFLGRMADVTEAESARLRTSAEADPEAPSGPSEHAAPLAGLTAARLTFRSGAQEIRLSGDAAATELYRGRFDGATPKIRVRDGRVLVQYPGIPFDFRKRVATMGLNPGVAWTIELVGGIGRIEADLRAIALQRFDLTGGSERIGSSSASLAARSPSSSSAAPSRSGSSDPPRSRPGCGSRAAPAGSSSMARTSDARAARSRSTAEAGPPRATATSSRSSADRSRSRSPDAELRDGPCAGSGRRISAGRHRSVRSSRR